MKLSEVRALFLQTSGRMDLVNTDGSDNGANTYINAGQRMLDEKISFQKSVSRYIIDVPANTMFTTLTRCNAINEVWVENADGRTELERIDLQKLREMYSTPADVDASTPIYYSSIPVGLSSQQSEVLSNTTEQYILNGGFDSSEYWTVGAAWTIASGLAAYAIGDGNLVQSVKSIPLGSSITYSLLVSTFTASEGETGKLYIVGSNTTEQEILATILTTGTATATVVTGIDIDTISLVAENLDAVVVDNLSVIRTATIMSYDYNTVKFTDSQTCRGLYIMPPTDVTYTLSVFGRFYSPTLIDNNDETFWTVEHPFALVWAAMYILEVSYRNMEGAKGWMMSINDYLSGIDSEQVEEDSTYSDQMEG